MKKIFNKNNNNYIEADKKTQKRIAEDRIQPPCGRVSDAWITDIPLYCVLCTDQSVSSVFCGVSVGFRIWNGDIPF